MDNNAIWHGYRVHPQSVRQFWQRGVLQSWSEASAFTARSESDQSPSILYGYPLRLGALVACTTFPGFVNEVTDNFWMHPGYPVVLG